MRNHRAIKGSAKKARRGQAGLTLIEMLVAMIILGFVMALVSEVVFQVSQVARAADAVSRGSAARWGTGWSASALFANLLAPDEAGDNAVLTGTTRQVSGFSSQPLDGSNLGIQPFEFELRPNREGGGSTTELLTTTTAGPRTIPGPVVVATFPGRAEFAFLDHAGEILLTWPAIARAEQNVESLPQAVMVRDPASGKILMWYGFEGEIYKPRRATNPFAGTSQ